MLSQTQPAGSEVGGHWSYLTPVSEALISSGNTNPKTAWH